MTRYTIPGTESFTGRQANRELSDSLPFLDGLDSTLTQSLYEVGPKWLSRPTSTLGDRGCCDMLSPTPRWTSPDHYQISQLQAQDTELRLLPRERRHQSSVDSSLRSCRSSLWHRNPAVTVSLAASTLCLPTSRPQSSGFLVSELRGESKSWVHSTLLQVSGADIIELCRSMATTVWAPQYCWLEPSDHAHGRYHSSSYKLLRTGSLARPPIHWHT